MNNDMKLLNDTLKCLNAFVSKEALGYAKKYKLTGEFRIVFKNGKLDFVDLLNGNSWGLRTLTKKEEREWGVTSRPRAKKKKR